METIKSLKLPFLIIFIAGIMFIFFAPYFPIDETRYLSVAWDMKLYHSFIVPLLNGHSYSHKPPFLFWLINVDWLIFGVNEKTLRIIPILFSMLNIILVYKTALLLWNDKKIAEYASLVLSSILVYLIWSSLIMFDVILTFWIMAGMYGIFAAYTHSNNTKFWILIGIAIGGGLLTKGPVIFVHILPVCILSFLWIPKREYTAKWHKGILVSLLIGVAILFVWLIPAILTGGESYRQAILWGQTVNRVVSSFAHQRPIWWYLPLIPIILLPWILFKPMWHWHWRNFRAITQDKGMCFLLVWIFSAFIIHSLISCKQVHYLIPLLPGVSLIIAKHLALNSKKGKSARLHYPVAILYISLGVGIFLLPFINSGNIREFSAHISILRFVALSLACIAMGLLMLLFKSGSVDRLMKLIALSSLGFIIIVLMNGNVFFKRYDVSHIARVLKAKQDEGYQILHYRKYDGQYQFAGRLTKPIFVLKSKNDVRKYIETHGGKIVLISYEKFKKVINPEDIDFQQPYRGKKVILWNRKGIYDFLKS